MPGRELRRSRRLITVLAAVAAAGVVTGLNVRSTMAAQATTLTSAAITPAGDSALIGSQADQLNGVACLSAEDCLPWVPTTIRTRRWPRPGTARAGRPSA
jgi:hypothetical protein